MIKNWDQFSPFLNHPVFVKKIKDKLEWDEIDDLDIYKTMSQMEILLTRFGDDIDFTVEELKEIEFFTEKAKEHGPKSVYWWSALHDCVESSALLMGTLLCLEENKTSEEVFVASINVDNNAWHQVICNVQLEPGMEFTLTKENTSQIIIYDLINPVYDEYKLFLEGAKCRVNSCDTLKRNIYEMNYYGDYVAPKYR